MQKTKSFGLLLTLAAIFSVMVTINTNTYASTNETNDTLIIEGQNNNRAAMELKATNENGNEQPVTGFELGPENVLRIEQGQSVDVVDNERYTKAWTQNVNEFKRNPQSPEGLLKQVSISDAGGISFAGYSPGIYVFDAIVEDREAYESIIVIGQVSDPEDNDSTSVVEKSRDVTNINKQTLTRILIS
jgi:hypothetical protein